MTASRVMVSVIPIVGIVMGSVVIFFYLLWTHREKMLLIERGLYHEHPLDWAMFSLLVGILLTTLGVVLSLVFFLVVGFGLALLGGLIPLSLGVGFLVFFAAWARRRPEA
ncbi:MAG: hypothetical protein A2087_01625 [Spirochaetes bacterium GWD1_61_31]|nr:MAG: hypothetical protein A2Y37_10460 [Spirochaetes bacterium GWB1_60_80]OHD29746.1 MAG: hypothetical protein A2004_04735 [Spirochaetes bacterium GWC1_61_12]OHD35774.1 MAG: hypothetical protein A2087_01625 [Spirochaetes bacterium GWD1_61_31]OHD42911.1 MAG: hypothetical protein A2Y35_14060 [Spirochaetes bacterium GWE1_60_18]OHD61289.1 MAG: hypothetical protein A2Y32_04155 [Spirochaetes bacterium GWF1_60_12]HAP43779.1 hypothetical protein [Spirochaetaceae bacterium]